MIGDNLSLQLTSYSGIFKYTVNNVGATRGDTPSLTRIPGPDVKITGKGMTIEYSLLSPMLDEEIPIDMLERSWSHAETGAPVTREQFMMILVSVSVAASFPFQETTVNTNL